MPYVRISVAADIDANQVARLQRGATELMARLLRKNPEVTVVSVSREHAECWAVGGAVAQGSMAALEAFVTQDTNTGEEKEDFISAAHTLLTDVIGELAGPLYVMVIEVPGQNWGYDGLSQLARHHGQQGRAVA